MFGFLLQWPTPLTLAMFPVLVWMYSRLSTHEERETEKHSAPIGGPMQPELPVLFRD